MPKGKKTPDEIIERIKAELPEKIRTEHNRTREQIAREDYGIGYTTMWSIIKDDPELDKAIDQAVRERDNDILPHKVKAKFISRLLNGESSEAGYIFYLTNKFPNEFKDRRALIGSIQVGAQVSTGVKRLEEISQDELISATKAIISRDHL